MRNEKEKEAQRDDSEEEMAALMKCPVSNNALRCEEFNLRSKKSNSHMFAAYANQEVTDFFEFCDKEGP